MSLHEVVEAYVVFKRALGARLAKSVKSAIDLLRAELVRHKAALNA